ncbi:hypothetical protein T484DRAFT_1941988 [Baffinella frigidus]|nr:hypothetical protein T484DRAFT_1941988 [Cryptophyta sp. CCMP2293]
MFVSLPQDIASSRMARQPISLSLSLSPPLSCARARAQIYQTNPPCSFPCRTPLHATPNPPPNIRRVIGGVVGLRPCDNEPPPLHGTLRRARPIRPRPHTRIGPP